MIKAIVLSTALIATLGLAACSGVPYAQRVSQRQAAYAAATGKSVDSFRFFGSLWSWEPLGNDRLAVYTRPGEAWLLDVPGCTNLEFANAIGLTSSLNQVSVGFDKVLTGRRFLPCTITRIHAIDVKRLKSVQDKQRKIDLAPRPAASAPSG